MNAITTKTFMNPEVIDAEVGEFVQRYKKAMKETAESIIAIGYTIYEACQVLGPKPLAAFCREIEMESTSATFKKLKKIGANYARIEANVEHLPSNWTTIYKLASMPEDDYARIVEADILTPYVTAAEINACLGRTSVRANDRNQPSNAITISVSSTNVANTALLISKIEELQTEFHFELQVRKELEQLILTHKKETNE